MTLTKNRLKREKRKTLRNNEYYNTQKLFDDLYDKSCKGYKFKHLVELITSENNIKLAYRNIKRNNGGKTSGVNKHTIDDIANGDIEKVIQYVRNRLSYYQPHAVKRVWIPKANGRQRPLGIPTIEDRLIQQCIKQILEPICEAKFHKHSYGFRANRSVGHAIARAMFLMNQSTFHYVVDIDIKSFFDNVKHSKLLKQMWNLGIQDKNLIAIIKKMIKAEIVGEGIPDKGTPQGGIISPLLSNIVLNEFDWWISSQWETHKTHYEYKGYAGDSNAKRALKDTSNLKEMYIVRYADDFKIFCKNYNDAQKIFIATQKWLKERLDLEISEEKSKITNLKTNYTDFLGFKLKVKQKNGKWISTSHLADNQKERIHQRLKIETKHLADNPIREQVMKYNSVILGLHTYYNIATEVNTDFKILAHKVLHKQFNLLRKNYKITKEYNFKGMYDIRYGRYNIKTYMVENKALIPIQAVTTQPPMCLSPKISNYTEEGRKANHKYLQKVDVGIMRYIMCNPVRGQSVEYNDNRIALYAGQGGCCAVTKKNLEIGNMEIHHKLPKHLKGTDSYKNLAWVLTEIHILIHATTDETISKYFEKLKLNEKELKNLNNLRVKSGNRIIKI